MLQLVCDKGQSLKEFTENNYAQASFAWNALLKNKDVKVNGKRVSGDITLYKGDIVCYYLTTKQAEKRAFSKVFEDENVCVVDKDSGVNSEAVFAALAREGECYFIHRLDRNTRGLLVFGKNEGAAELLLQAFRKRQVEKKYHALCVGVFPADKELLTGYLKKDADKCLVKVYDTPVHGSERILTEYQVLERLPEGLTRIEVTLHTGKTHQIRAHFAHFGFPILGDMKYGNSAKNKEFGRTRQCLVAKSLAFEEEDALSYLSGKIFQSEFEV